MTASVVIEPGGTRSTPIARAAAEPAAEPEAPRVSVVVPSYDEAAALPELVRRIGEGLGDVTFEVIVVDDGCTDATWQVLADLHRGDPRIKGVRLRKNFGKAMALAAGFQRTRGEVVVTMDGDLQDDPADLPTFLAKIGEGFDVVVGWKVERVDPANRRVLSRIFNAIVRGATGLKLHDVNCGFKAYRREVIGSIPLYGDLFRFIPAFAAWQGFRVTEVPIKHHVRAHGKSRYGLERILRGFFDLLSVMFLTRYSRKPMHLFGLIGLVLTGIGVVTEGYLTLLWFKGYKIGNRPLLLLGALEIILGIQFFSMGFIGEFLTYQNQKRLDTYDLPIREEIRPIPDAYFDRFETPKYRSTSPVQRALIRRFVARLHALVGEAGPVGSVLEVGVGEGFLSGHLSETRPGARFTGVDLDEGDLARLRRLFPRIDARRGSAYDLAGLGGPFDLVLCAEVLEHLDEPGRALDAMLALRPRRLILTVPHEPFFRLGNLARGKNVRRLGDDEGHVNHWGLGSFRRLLSGRLAVERLTTSFPWLLALASPR